MKTLLISILGLLVVLVAGGFLLDDTYAVERTTTIQADAAQIAPYLSNLETWEDWTAWNSHEIAELERSFGAVKAGAGASMSWKDKDGTGSLTITDVRDDGGIDYALTMNYMGEAKSTGSIVLTPVAGGTRITWQTGGDLGSNLLARYFGLFMDRMVGGDLEEGLSTLKVRVEGS